MDNKYYVLKKITCAAFLLLLTAIPIVNAQTSSEKEKASLCDELIKDILGRCAEECFTYENCCHLVHPRTGGPPVVTIEDEYSEKIDDLNLGVEFELDPDPISGHFKFGPEAGAAFNLNINNQGSSLTIQPFVVESAKIDCKNKFEGGMLQLSPSATISISATFTASQHAKYRFWIINASGDRQSAVYINYSGNVNLLTEPPTLDLTGKTVAEVNEWMKKEGERLWDIFLQRYDANLTKAYNKVVKEIIAETIPKPPEKLIKYSTPSLAKKSFFDVLIESFGSTRCKL